MRKIMLLLALLVITSNAYAQLNSASGRVFDKEDGQPIIGATVRVDGTNTAVATDEQGTFSLSGLKSDAQITVSYIGYFSQTCVESLWWLSESKNANLSPDPRVWFRQRKSPDNRSRTRLTLSTGA